ncbi:MAG: AraC family transcriptional regulator [Prevotella sp.]|nr:AraC family transcriptional regulator [Prevotella sp.]
MNEPKLMNLSRMRNILEPHIRDMHDNVFITNDFAIIHGGSQVFRLLVRQKPPFTIDDYRFGIITQGEIRGNINLVEKRITAGTLMFVGPGAIINPIRFSPDLEIYGIGFSSNFLPHLASGQMPASFNGQTRDFQLTPSAADVVTARSIIDTLWHIVHQPSYDIQTVSSLFTAQIHHYDALYRQSQDQRRGAMSRQQNIFDRFIYLVNQNADREHLLAFYADKMCITERYLGSVVKQTSGITAKEWIDRAIIMRIKVALRHSDKTIAQIAEEMHFATPSFFCKYFKRLTGKTPLEYREG